MTTSTGYSSAAGERYALIRELLGKDFPAPARVVEFGAAPGEQAIRLAHAGYHVTAIDIGVVSDAWEGAAEGTMVQRFEEAGVQLVLWNLEELPYPLADASFDAVVMTEVFEHLREYPATSLSEARRVLQPGGCLYFTTPNAAYLRNRLQLLLGRNTATPLGDWIGGVPHARHAREYTFAEILELLRRSDFELTLVTSRHLHVGSGRSSRTARLGKRLLDRVAQMRPSLGPAIVIVARRPAAAIPAPLNPH